VGKARYGLMLREDGLVLDDGTTARLGSDHYLVSTTTANAGRVMQHMEFARQALWPELDVQLASVTEQWAQYAVAGRKARAVLRRLFGPAAALDDEAFPHLGVGVFDWKGVEARLFRLSFSGEQAYEVAVPAHYGAAMIEAIWAVGEDLGLAPYGTEALGVMRIEKGHVGGAEINGQTIAGDLGLGRMLSTKKDFIGRVLARRPALIDPDRPVLTGFKPVDPTARLRSGAHFLDLGAATAAEHDQGYMTSVAYSPTLGTWIGLGLLKHGLARHGSVLRAYDPIRDQDVEVEACAPVFFDPEGARLHGRY
jgi:sarcosine oxidase subunit alpha